MRGFRKTVFEHIQNMLLFVERDGDLLVNGDATLVASCYLFFKGKAEALH
jgi:hypothetical protein